MILLQISIIKPILQKLDVTFIKDEQSMTVGQQLQHTIPNRFVKETKLDKIQKLFRRQTMIRNSQINKEMNPLNIVHQVSKPGYGMLFEHQGYLLQGLRYLYLLVAIKLPQVTDLLHDPDLMPECDRWAEQYDITTSQRSSIYHCKPYNEPIHQAVCRQLFDTYRDTMQSIAYYRSNITFKIKNVMPALLPNKNTEVAEQLIRSRKEQLVYFCQE